MIVVFSGLLWLDWWLETTLWNTPDTDPWVRTALCSLPTVVILTTLLLAGFVEVAKLAKASGVRILTVVGIVATPLIAMRDYWATLPGNISSKFVVTLTSPMTLLAIMLLALFVEQMVRFRTEDAIRRVGASLLAIMYLGLGGAFILAIRSTSGVPMLVLFLVSVKFTDIGAYFTGSAIGKHKMIPWLSPGKTWEGLVGGVVISVLASIAVYKFLNIDFLVTWQVAVFAAVVGLAGQFGDLCESLLKRSAKQKDSGGALPEFGGVLDVIDSPLLAAPIAYLMLAILV